MNSAVDAVTQVSSGRLIFSAIIGIVLLLILIIKGKLQPIIAILSSSIFIGIATGMPYESIIASINSGIGVTLKSIALLVGLGSMFGSILEISGGAQQIANTLVRKFGDEKAAWALGITGLVIAMPVYFDAGLIILIPIAFSLARRTKKSTLTYVIPLLAGLTVGHAFIPPTPGPILIASMLNVELGYVIIVGLICGTVSMIIAGPIFGKYIGNKIYVPIPEFHTTVEDIPNDKLPKFATVVSIIFIPLVLIILNTVSKAVPAMSAIAPILSFVGEPFIALLIATIVAMIILGFKHGYSKEELQKVMTKSLGPTGLILLVTASGGVLKYILINSGIGEIIGYAISSGPFPYVVIAFIVAGLVRISVGSATVSMTMAAGIMAAMPGLASYSQLYLACVTAAVASGAVVCSHFNDSGFWLVTTLLNIDEKTTLKTWTVMVTLVGFSGFIVALIISLFA